jgi:hypothetical protein
VWRSPAKQFHSILTAPRLSDLRTENRRDPQRLSFLKLSIELRFLKKQGLARPGFGAETTQTVQDVPDYLNHYF